MKKTPCTTYILLAANLIAFFASELLGGSEDYNTMLRLGAASAPLIKGGEYWRLFTSMFLHFGFMHLANNMIVLFALGENLENVLGSVRYALLYLAGGLAGNLPLVMLGFSKANINKVLPKILQKNPAAKVEEIIKTALQML